MMDMGIRGKLYKWIKCSIRDRAIETKMNDALSSKEVLEEGLPQGSSLSSTLFIIYINDLITQIKAEKALYADDFVIWLSHENVHSAAQRLSNDLQILNKYRLT
jgi:hypothetical protein